MELAAAIAVIAAAIAPFITALFAREDLSPTTKRVIAGVVAVVLGAVVAITTGQLTGIPDTPLGWLTWIVITVGIVISLAQGFYRQWKGAADAVTRNIGNTSKQPEDPI